MFTFADCFISFELTDVIAIVIIIHVNIVNIFVIIIYEYIVNIFVIIICTCSVNINVRLNYLALIS